MRRSTFRALWVSYLALCLSVMVASPAAAYIDPGSGSLVFQAVVAAAVAVPVAMASFWGRIRAFFSRRARR